MSAQVNLPIDPRTAFQDIGDVRLEDCDDLRAGEMLPERAQGRRRHDDVPDPVRQKNSNLHGSKRPPAVAVSASSRTLPETGPDVRGRRNPPRSWPRPPGLSGS